MPSAGFVASAASQLASPFAAPRSAPPALPAGTAAPLALAGPSAGVSAEAFGGATPFTPGQASVAPLRRLIEPDVLVLDPAGLSAGQRTRIRRLVGVAATLPLASGALSVDGTMVRGIAADPGQLRRWTPAPTASSDGLWRAVASGELAASFDAGKNLRLPLGGPVSLHGPGAPARQIRLGALASLALPGLDFTVAPAVGTSLAMTPDAALLVSAPGVDLGALRSLISATIGSAAQVLLLHEVTVVRDAGEFLTRRQLDTVVRAALSRVGRPYVWGATGPDAFDCSGLVGYAYAAAGIAVPRTSEQLWLAGPHVPADTARAGDLLFWANDPAAPEDMDHVALYLGNGLMVSAPHTGDVVHVAPVYAANFRGVVRLDPTAASRVGGGMWTPGTAAPR
ncbi:MAG: hypothetical protein NVSMB55_25760 [Mycobacteriales bacterium]